MTVPRRMWTKRRRKFVVGVVYVLVAMVLWSTVPIATKFLVRDGSVFSPALLSAIRLAMAAGIFIGLRLAYVRAHKAPFFGKIRFTWWLLAAGGGLAAHYILYTIGLEYTSATATSVVTQVHAPATVLLAALVLGERITPQKGIGMGVVMLGIMLVLVRSVTAADFVGTTRWLGNIIEIIAGLAWPLYAIGQTKLLQQDRSQHVLMPIFILATLFSLAALPFTGPMVSRAPGVMDWVLVVFLGVGSTAAAYWIFAAGMRRIETSLGAMLNVLTPIIVLILAHFTLGEALRPGVIGGLALVICGLTLIIWRRSSSPLAVKRPKLARQPAPTALQPDAVPSSDSYAAPHALAPGEHESRQELPTSVLS